MLWLHPFNPVMYSCVTEIAKSGMDRAILDSNYD